MSKKIGLFIDVSNVYYCVSMRYNNGRLDYEKFLEVVKKKGDLYRAIAYGAQVQDEAIDFTTCLKKIGYDTKYKRPRERPNKDLQRINWSVGIAMDIVRIINNLDIVVLASASSEMASLIEWIKEKGVRVIVFACGISKDLKDVADEYIEIREELLLDEILDEKNPTT